MHIFRTKINIEYRIISMNFSKVQRIFLQNIFREKIHAHKKVKVHQEKRSFPFKNEADGEHQQLYQVTHQKRAR